MPSARENRKPLALFLGVAMVLMIIGPGLAAEPVATDIMTTGHTNFVNAGTQFNNCFAGIAGAMLQRVVWFNGATLFSRMTDGDGDTYIYAMEHLNDDDEDTPDRFDPSKETLFESGNSWKIEDENRPSVVWNITEYYYLDTGSIGQSSEVDPDDPGEAIPRTDGDAQEKVYVWVVQVGQAIEDPTIRREYNFVTLVDTCKFHSDSTGRANHTDGYDGGGDPNDPSSEHDDHDPNDVPEGEEAGHHEHPTFNVDLFVGGQPESIPVPADPGGDDGGDGSDGGDGGSSS